GAVSAGHACDLVGGGTFRCCVGCRGHGRGGDGRGRRGGRAASTTVGGQRQQGGSRGGHRIAPVGSGDQAGFPLPLYTPMGYCPGGETGRCRGDKSYVAREWGSRSIRDTFSWGRGRRMVKTEPAPGRGEVAVRVPPWASINALEMVRPIPAPPLSRLRAASPR